MKLIFEWDEIKAEVNIKKHKVSFEEGKTIFNDPFLFTCLDDRQVGSEERYLNIGLSARGAHPGFDSYRTWRYNTYYQLQEGDTKQKGIL